MTGIQRFDSKVFLTNRCLLWTGTSTGNGYGRFWHEGKMVLAHRFAYECAYGPIPDGLQIDHLCRVRCCVNPDHMDVVTNAENTKRGLTGQWKRPDICKRGHAMTPENTYTYPHGGRECRACKRMHNKKRRSRRAALETDK